MPQTPTNASLQTGVDGFDFTPTTSLLVTNLGWYDHEGDGLVNDHEVGIFVTATQTLAAPSATITTTDPIIGSSDFRFKAVTPFLLNAGTTYTLLGFGEGPVFDPYVNDPVGGLDVGPGISFVGPRSAIQPSFGFTTAAGQAGAVQDVFEGPNFLYTAPEPSGAVLLLAGFATITRMGRGRKSA